MIHRGGATASLLFSCAQGAECPPFFCKWVVKRNGALKWGPTKILLQKYLDKQRKVVYTTLVV